MQLNKPQSSRSSLQGYNLRFEEWGVRSLDLVKLYYKRFLSWEKIAVKKKKLKKRRWSEQYKILTCICFCLSRSVVDQKGSTRANCLQLIQVFGLFRGIFGIFRDETLLLVATNSICPFLKDPSKTMLKERRVWLIHFAHPRFPPSPAHLELMMLEKWLPISLHLWAAASETNHPICISV